MITQRVVFDCNTLLQALASPGGPAGRCLQLVLDGEIELFVSPTVLEELRDVALRPKVMRKLRLTPDRVERFLVLLAGVGVLLIGISEVFVYRRDPDDAHYINLALAADARLIVSRDLDLLDLMDASTSDGRDFLARFPALRIVTPQQFLSDHR